MENLDIGEWILAVAPIVVLLVGAYYFMRTSTAVQQRAADYSRRQAEALERIATALEKRP